MQAPPPGKSSPERDSDIVMDDKSSVPDVKMVGRSIANFY